MNIIEQMDSNTNTSKMSKIELYAITELKRIQSFPDNYIIDGSNKYIIMQIGNAVHVDLLIILVSI